MTYEKAIKRLEEIALQMESGKLTLDESIKYYEESVKLTEFCYSKLEAFKQRIYEVTSSGLILNRDSTTTAHISTKNLPLTLQRTAQKFAIR